MHIIIINLHTLISWMSIPGYNVQPNPGNTIQPVPEYSVQLFWCVFFLFFILAGCAAPSTGDNPSYSVQFKPVYIVQLNKINTD